MKDFHDLQVWQKAHRLALDIYATSRTFPREERYGLTSQLRRAAASIPANLAEGCGRNGDAELARFCQISMGSACELEYHLLLARDLGLLPEQPYELLLPRVVEVKRMLASLLSRLTRGKSGQRSAVSGQQSAVS
jgi:four helix bundle protein